MRTLIKLIPLWIAVIFTVIWIPGILKSVSNKNVVQNLQIIDEPEYAVHEIGESFVYDKIFTEEDGSYIVTVAIKNTSAYQATVYKNAITVKYGNGTILDNRMLPYPDTEILRSINEPVIPSGRTVE